MVSDTGIGMSADQLRRISQFEAFVQSDTSMSRRFGGTGLGLRISKSFAELLNGEISVESEEGVGSIFTLSLYINESADISLIDPETFTGTTSGGRSVVAPHMILVRRTKPDARTIVEPEPTAFSLFSRHFQTLLLPDTLDPFVVDPPTIQPKQRMDHPVAVAAEHRRQLDDALGQRLFIISHLRHVTLRGTWLLE